MIHLSLIIWSFIWQIVPTAITGKWEVWIPGAVTYYAKDADIYRKYTPGAPMNTFELKADGTYTWGIQKGKVKKVKPWYAQEGISYYSVSDARKNTYEFWYKKEEDKLIFLFGEVGGHAATGTRITAKKTDFQKGDEVEILWNKIWYSGKILEIKGDSYKISYDGWSSKYHEWVSKDRLRKN